MTSIIIAEDSELSRLTMRNALVQAGYEVVEAITGEEALALCQKKMPSLAILDIGLPGMSGLEVAEYLKGNIPFLIITVDDSEPSRQKCIDAGAYSYIIKPIKPDQLVPLTEAALARASDHQNITKALDCTQKISVAIGIIMAQYNLPYEEARKRLLRHASNSRQNANSVAEDIIQAVNTLNELHPGDSKSTPKASPALSSEVSG